MELTTKHSTREYNFIALEPTAATVQYHCDYVYPNIAKPFGKVSWSEWQ
mgnify:CR=1 FL=1